jgi:hypothetical protein
MWIGAAAATKQITTLTVAGTWAGNDTYTLTMNGRDLVVTIVNGTTTAQVAESLRDAWNAAARIDGTQSTTNTNTSNFGGQEFGEFAEVDAVIYTTSTSVVRLIGKVAGRPFTVTGAASTAGDGDVTVASAQAATGPHHWDNPDNWDTGTVPADGDMGVFKDGSVSVKYGLPNPIYVTIVQYQSFTGDIGLLEYNVDNPLKPYREYRQRYVRLDDDGAVDTTNEHKFGLGDGPRVPQVINIRQRNEDASDTLVTSATIFNTGVPKVPGTKALNLDIANEGAAGGTISVLKGSVNLCDQDGIQPAYTTLNIGYTDSQLSDAEIVVQNHSGALTVNQSGGKLLIYEPGSVALTGARTFNVSGGECTIRDLATSGTVTVTLLNCRFTYNATKTIASCTVGTNATFDAEKDLRAFTVTALDLYQGASWLDEFARATYTAGIDLNRCGIDDVTVRVGNNRRLTIGAVA